MDPYYSYTGGAPPMSTLPLLANPPIPPRRPITPQANLYASPAGPAAPQQQPQPQGQFTLWDALRSLFSGGQQAQAPGAPQGMTGMLNSAPGSFANANPSNRYG
jgi:hypothetical protein